MAIEVKSRPDFRKISEEMERGIENALDRQLADEAAEIVQRTQGGHDVDNRSFAPYSAPYLKVRRDKGRGSRPDLTFTGSMLNSITHTVTRVGSEIIGTIFFSSSAEALKAKGNIKSRKFFGLSKEQIINLRNAISRAINGRG